MTKLESQVSVRIVKGVSVSIFSIKHPFLFQKIDENCLAYVKNRATCSKIRSHGMV